MPSCTTCGNPLAPAAETLPLSGLDVPRHVQDAPITICPYCHQPSNEDSRAITVPTHSCPTSRTQSHSDFVACLGDFRPIVRDPEREQ